MELTLAARKAITKAQLGRWPKASRSEKTAILDTVCGVTGWHRDHARKAIRAALADLARGGPPVRRPRDPVRVYDQAAVDLLVKCWAILDGPSGKRLVTALPAVLDNLATHGHLGQVSTETIVAVRSMSAATIDRRLAPVRQGLVAGKGMSHTKPGSMLKASIPQKTWAQWDDTQPGHVQIDLVGHEGGDNNGHFHYTLNATDVATGWTETITVKSKGERIVATALEQLQLRFPFHLAGIHSDNGSEFINHHLTRWCEARQISFTRGRPSRSNDQAFAEQKNWSVVRRHAGYHRYDTPRELDLLNQLWALVTIEVNLFLPQQKLVSKIRHGATVRKRYDTATTPADRLTRDHPDLLDPHDRAQLQQLATDTDLLKMKHQIADIQANLLELARRRGQTSRRAKINAVYVSRQKIGPPKRAFSDESTNPSKRAS